MTITQFKPDSHDAWYNQGVILDNLGRYDEALKAYNIAYLSIHIIHIYKIA